MKAAEASGLGAKNRASGGNLTPWPSGCHPDLLSVAPSWAAAWSNSAAGWRQ